MEQLRPLHSFDSGSQDILKVPFANVIWKKTKKKKKIKREKERQKLSDAVEKLSSKWVNSPTAALKRTGESRSLFFTTNSFK